MRNQLLAAAALLSLAAVPALAQTTTQPPASSPTQPVGAPPAGAASATQKGPMGVEPADMTPGHNANAASTAAPAATTGETANQQPMTTGNNSMPARSMMPGHEPASAQASNISPADTRSDIAPRLPMPPVGPDANAQQLLQAAQTALSHRHSGEAQEALERAETRLLDRSTMPDAAGAPDSKPAIGLISQARDALGRRDWSQANDAISQAMKAPAVMRDADANGPT